MRVSAAILEGSTPGNPRATHGNGRGFVAELCPRDWGNRVLRCHDCGAVTLKNAKTLKTIFYSPSKEKNKEED